MLLILLSSLLFGQDPDLRNPDAEIIVEASRDFEVYVAPIKVVNKTKDIEGDIGEYSAFSYASMHNSNAKVSNGLGGYEPITLNYNKFNVFNKETIKYSWDNCDYEKDHKKCSYQNSHYLLETIVTIDENELVVLMMLYDSNMIVVSQGVTFDRKVISWIKQQELNSTVESLNSNNQTGQNCSTGSCQRPMTQGGLTNHRIISTNKPKEEAPIKWEIPHFLLDKHISQASLLLWCSTRIDI